MKNKYPYLFFAFLLILFSCSSESEEPTPTPEPDTVAPTITFGISGSSNSSSEPIVVSNQIEVNINAQDAGGIAKVEAFIDNQKVGEDTTAPYQITIDISGFTSKASTLKLKNYTLRIDATDKSGNSSSSEQLINIINKTPLITINFPAQYVNPEVEEFYIFASTMDGGLLGLEKVEPANNSITISTIEDISENEEYMLTFAELNNKGIARFSTISNLTATLLPEINLGTYPIFQPYSGVNTFQATGFDENSDVVMNILGNRYLGSLDYANYESVRIDRSNCIDCDYPSSNSLYLSILDNSQGNYKFLTSDWDIDENFIFSPDIFTDEGIEEKSIQINNVPGQTIDHTNFRLFGYFSEQDFENSFYHFISGISPNSPDSDKLPYFFNNIFEKYTYEITINGYYTNRSGMPLDLIEPLDWTIDYTLLDKNISIEKNSADDILGKVILGSIIVDGNYIPYAWELIFDSKKTNEINVPEIPEEIRLWEFYESFSAQELQVRQVEIKKYENISDFGDYLKKIIAPNKKPLSVSNSIQSIFINNESKVHGGVDDWLID